MGDPRNPSSWNSIRSSFRGSESHVLPSARDPATRTRTSASKIRRRPAGLVGAGGARGAGGAGGTGGKQLLVRFLVRSITNPRTLVLGLVTFVMAPSLYFFSRSADWKEEPGAGRLAEPQGLAVDLDHGSHHQLPAAPGPPPTLQDQHRPTPTQKAAEKQATERAPADRTTPSGKRRPPSLLPVEVFRDVPPEECLTSPLWEKRVDPDEYEFGCKEIEDLLAGEKTLIGNGNIRDVFLVERGGRKLVVKALREDFELRASRTRAEKIHRWEAAALHAVRGHSNIVGLLGLCESSSVTEFFPTRLDDLVLVPDAKPLPIETVVAMALDAARGLQGLHESRDGTIVHFDIKPAQMMLDSEGRLKINDLNMCSFPPADADGNTCAYPSRACNSGPFRSPENIAGEPLTEKLDVYSLAMTYYTMLNLKPPYTGEPAVKARILEGIPPFVDPSWHPGFMEIVQDMWQRDPKARPSAKRVVQRLEMLQESMRLETAREIGS